MARRKKYPLVMVKWIDSATTHGWQHPEELEQIGPAEITSFGLLVRETKYFIVISTSETNAYGTVAHPMAIPRVAIRKLRRIKRPDA